MQCNVQSNPITRICNSPYSSSSFPPVTKIRITFPIMVFLKLGKLENSQEKIPHQKFLPRNYTKTKKSKSKELLLLSHPQSAKWNVELLLELKTVQAHNTFFHRSNSGGQPRNCGAENKPEKSESCRKKCERPGAEKYFTVKNSAEKNICHSPLSERSSFIRVTFSHYRIYKALFYQEEHTKLHSVNDSQNSA